jgi:chromosome segregation ATPase
VQNETQGGEEVTQQHADLVARLKNARETERRLQAILEQRTDKVADVLAVKQEIARVRGEIEQMEAAQKSLEHRVSFASIELTLAEEYKAQINSPSPAISTRIHNAMVAGYRDAVENVVGIVLFLASDGPTLLAWLTILAPVAWLARRRWLRATGQLSSTTP